MALVKSVEISLGIMMPDFELKDAHGREFSSDGLMGKKGLLVVFTCNHCPYAMAQWPRLIKLAKHARKLGVNTVAINPNINPDYPDDAPDKMIKKEKELGIDFPYLVDETQHTAENFQAQCTPDIYLYDAKQSLVYHGRLDDNWEHEDQVKKEELKEAVNNLASGKPIAKDQLPSMGCSIKWKY